LWRYGHARQQALQIVLDRLTDVDAALAELANADGA
jgi:hypothetical protein